MEISLHDILKAREDRVQQQKHLLAEYRSPLLCFTMNIAGPIKTSPLIQRGFEAGLAALDCKLPKAKILFRQASILPTGCEAFYVVDMPAQQLKSLCTAIEEETPLGRLWDIDVIEVCGNKLERETQRGCIVCGASGRGCASSRAHSVDQLQEVTINILTQHFAKSDQEYIASLAVQSLLDEVNTTPKPGLVDQRNNGSHKDMNIHHFIESAHVLKPYFAQCMKIGQETALSAPDDTFTLLRHSGLAAEKAMYQVTGGINTHKGIIYTMGILCGSIGRLWSAESPIADIPCILNQCAELVQNAVASDFADATGTTAGERLYLQHKIGGIRAEAAAGLPSVANVSLPVYQAALKDGLSTNDAGILALYHLIASVSDTNLYHRGGTEGAAWARDTAKKLLSANTPLAGKILEDLDDAFIERNLSPGGCADLLAVTYFLSSLQSN